MVPVHIGGAARSAGNHTGRMQTGNPYGVGDIRVVRDLKSREVLQKESWCPYASVVLRWCDEASG